MFNKLRLSWQLLKLRFRGVLKPLEPRAAIELRQEARKRAEHDRILAMWFESAREAGIDLSREAMVLRFAPEFQPETKERETEAWREGAGSGAEVYEALHRQQF